MSNKKTSITKEDLIKFGFVQTVNEYTFEYYLDRHTTSFSYNISTDTHFIEDDVNVIKLPRQLNSMADIKELILGLTGDCR